MRYTVYVRQKYSSGEYLNYSAGLEKRVDRKAGEKNGTWNTN